MGNGRDKENISNRFIGAGYRTTTGGSGGFSTL
jgi:hypothetical protein